MINRLLWSVQRAAAANGVVLSDQTAQAVIEAVWKHHDGRAQIRRQFPQETWHDPDRQKFVRKSELGGLYQSIAEQGLVPVGLPIEHAVYLDHALMGQGPRLPIDTPRHRVDAWWYVEVTWTVLTRTVEQP